jgi:hypothetical protein
MKLIFLVIYQLRALAQRGDFIIYRYNKKKNKVRARLKDKK